jgi:hypothetical protein
MDKNLFSDDFDRWPGLGTITNLTTGLFWAMLSHILILRMKCWEGKHWQKALKGPTQQPHCPLVARSLHDWSQNWHLSAQLWVLSNSTENYELDMGTVLKAKGSSIWTNCTDRTLKINTIPCAGELVQSVVLNCQGTLSAWVHSCPRVAPGNVISTLTVAARL